MKVASRKAVRSPLAAWLNANGMTMREFGRRLGVEHPKMSGIIDGRSLPSLMVAYEIERLTLSEVPIESWLGIDFAKRAMAELRARQPKEFQPESFRKKEGDDGVDEEEAKDD